MPAKVEFALEASVDTGGPRREFLRLLAKEVRDGDYFQAGNAGSFFVCNTSGYRVCKCIVINLVAMRLFVTFQANHYKILGCYAAISIIQGGPGFPFFHAHAYGYLSTGIWSPVRISVENLPNENLRTVVNNVCYLVPTWYNNCGLQDS